MRWIETTLLVLALGCGTAWGQDEKQQKRIDQPDYRLFQSGYLKVVAGEFAEAVKVFDAFAAAHPQSNYCDDALFWKAYGIAAQEQYAVAVTIYQSVVDKYPDGNYADDALIKIAELYETKIHDYDKAIEKYEELIKKYPSSPLRAEAGFNVGNARKVGKNDYDRAMEDYKQAQDDVNRMNKVNPEQTWVWKAADKELKFLQENKDHDWVPLTHFFKAQGLAAAGDHAQALEKFRKILKDYAGAKICDDVEIEIAACLARSGDIDGAIAQLKAFKEKYPSSPLIGKATNDLADQEKKREPAKVK